MKLGILFLLSLAAAVHAAPAKTGPVVGAKIPAFEARDQQGRVQTFDTLKGPKGLVLLFVRSADW